MMPRESSQQESSQQLESRSVAITELRAYQSEVEKLLKIESKTDNTNTTIDRAKDETSSENLCPKSRSGGEPLSRANPKAYSGDQYTNPPMAYQDSSTQMTHQSQSSKSIRSLKSTTHEQRQHQQQAQHQLLARQSRFEVDSESELDASEATNCDLDRGGPTPTNDLIRALIHRDRRALGCDTLRTPSERQLADGLEQRTCPRAEPFEYEPTVGPKQSALDLTALISKCQQLQLSSGRANQTASCSEVANSHRPRASLLAADAHSDEATIGANQVLAYADRELEANLAADVNSASWSASAEVSPLAKKCPELSESKWSDFSESSDFSARKASTYLLPLILNRANQQRDADRVQDDDDDDDEDDDDFDKEIDIRIGVEEPDDNWLSLSSSSDRTDKERDDVMDGSCDTSGHFKRLGNSSGVQATSAMRLPISASSPSALSTPTNESRGCGGPCCSERPNHGLRRQSNDNPTPSEANFIERQDPASQMSGKDLQWTHVGWSGQKKPATASSNWRLADTNAPYNGPMSQSPRPRVGSNPLDRLRLSERSKLRSSIADSSAFIKQQLLATTSNKRKQSDSSNQKLVSPRNQHQVNNPTPLKRHSIISLISGAPVQAGSQLMSRLRHSRQHRASVGSTNMKSRTASIEQQQQHQQATPQYDPLIPESGFKIVVMGTSGSGKTSIIQRFLYDAFSERHSPTVEDTYFIEFPYKKNMINISITDTSGTYQFPAMKRLAISSGDAFILVYSVDEPQSFDYLEQLRLSILNEREQAYLDQASASTSSTVSASSESLIATSSSMCSSSCSSSDNSRRSSISAAEAALKTRRTRKPPMVIVANKHDLGPEKHLVDSDEIEALAVIDWDHGFVRSSAAFNWNINEIFQQVLKQARQPPTLTEAIISKRRKSLPPKMPH